MINRVLIRRKVVQILYSYMLTRSEFRIDQAPETTSRDRRYAYTVYIRTLLLILELSGYSARTGAAASPLAGTRHDSLLHDSAMAKALATDNTLRQAILKGASGIEKLDPALNDLYDRIKASSEYRAYSHKRGRSLADDVKLWCELIEKYISQDPDILALSREAGDDFTNRGFKSGFDAVTVTLNNFSDNRALYREALAALDSSLDKAYELYHALLQLTIELTDLEAQRIEAGRNKHLPTPEDLNPNTRMVDNEMVALLRDNPTFQSYRDKNQMTWITEPVMLRTMLASIRESDIYRQYMDAPVTDLQADCEFWRNILKSVILPSDALAEALENESVYWNDDLEVMGTFALKTIRHIETRTGQEESVEALPKFKDEEDERFGAQLFELVVDHRKEYREYIDRFVKSDLWDAERLAFMDIIIMMTAIAELLNYPQIPVAVTMNEYVEIANYYSSPKSGQFVNGVLYSVATMLREEGKLLK